MEVTLELPWPPSLNRCYRTFRGRTLLSRIGREYRKKVLSLLAAERLPCFSGPIEVEVQLFPPDSRRRDIDNLMKGTLDSLQAAGLITDDSLITHLNIFKKEPCRPDGKAVIRITDDVRDAK